MSQKTIPGFARTNHIISFSVAIPSVSVGGREMHAAMVIDDDENMRWVLSNLLIQEGFETCAVEDGEEGLSKLRETAPDLILLDLRLPGWDGLQVLEKIKKFDRSVPVIVVTGFGEVSSAVKAMKLGAFDYITKPFDNQELLDRVRCALENRRQIRFSNKDVKPGAIVGNSEAMRRVFYQIEQVAPTELSVLIQGGSGTGKEVMARLIHELSDRGKKPFVAVDSGALPETLMETELFGYEKGAFTGADERKLGSFELAEEGTLFFDEISNLSAGMQAKLLRVLERKEIQRLGGHRIIPVDLRVMAASNVMLEQEVASGNFRLDLFYRLNEFNIWLPPLRERGEDILLLARYFLELANQEMGKKVKGFTEQAVKSLMRYHWPGNVRELKNAIYRAVLLADEVLEPQHFPFYGEKLADREAFGEDLASNNGGSLDLKKISRKASEQAERQVIKFALQSCNGNKSQAARLLKVDYKTLHTKAKKLGL